MSDLLLVVFAFALLVLESAISVVVPLHPIAPSVLLPLVLYFGVTPDVTLARGTGLAFTAGLLSDELTGAPLGLTTFTFVACFLLTRVAGLRLFLRGVPFQIAATTGIAITVSGVMLSLCAIFEPQEVFPLVMTPSGWIGAIASRLFGDHVPLVGHVTLVATLLVASGLATGIVSPLVYVGARRIDALRARAHHAVGEGART